MKIIAYIVSIIFLFVSFFFYQMWHYIDHMGDYDRSKYITGGYNRTHVDWFGIRRFEIFRLSNQTEDSTKRWVLSDNQGESIEQDVYCYKEIVPYVYTEGDEGYTKLNYETAEVLQSKNLNEFSSEDQSIFKKLEEGKDGIKNEKGKKWGNQNG